MRVVADAILEDLDLLLVGATALQSKKDTGTGKLIFLQKKPRHHIFIFDLIDVIRIRRSEDSRLRRR